MEIFAVTAYNHCGTVNISFNQSISGAEKAALKHITQSSFKYRRNDGEIGNGVVGYWQDSYDNTIVITTELVED